MRFNSTIASLIRACKTTNALSGLLRAKPLQWKARKNRITLRPIFDTRDFTTSTLVTESIKYFLLEPGLFISKPLLILKDSLYILHRHVRKKGLILYLDLIKYSLQIEYQMHT